MQSSALETRVKSPVRRIYERFAHLIHEVGKFGIVGGVSYGIDVLVFNVFLALTGEPYVPKIISTVVAATAAFFGNRYWTWRHRERSKLSREYLLYFVFNAVGLGLTLACLWFSHGLLGSLWPGVFHSRLADNVSGNVLGVIAASLFRFWAYRRFVFRRTVLEEA